MTDTAELTGVADESLMGRIADEYMTRLHRGERVEIEEYVRRYPQLAAYIRQVFPAFRVMGGSAAGMLSDEQAAQAGPATGGQLGDYRIVREIGRGGMGIVYEAEQVSLGRRVALKVLPFAAVLDDKQLQRFKNEAHAAAQLHHTNIVPVFSVGCERGVHYYAMQYIDGQTLAQVIAELCRLSGQPAGDAARKAASRLTTALASGSLLYAPEGRPTSDSGAGPLRVPVPVAEGSSGAIDVLASDGSTRSPAFFRSVANLGIQAAQALEHAHELGMVHRDIKPSNLLLDSRGNLWVTDFGLAHVESDPGLTMTGDIVGTVRYMSPEQALGKRALVDQRTDIYSLGVTLYELLALKPAFDGRDRQELLRQIAFEEPRALRKVNSAIPRELETIVLKAVNKNPEQRYVTAQDLADDLGRFLEDKPIRAKRPTLFQRAAKWSRRHRAVVGSGVVLLVMAVVALSVGTVFVWHEQARTAEALAQAESNFRTAESHRQRAEQQRERAKANFQLARDAVDRMLTGVAEQLRDQPHMEQVRRGLLEDALSFYESFLERRGEDVSVRAETARAYRRVGEIRNMLGDNAEAVDALRSSVELLHQLVEVEPESTTHHHDLGHSLSALAGVLGRTGQQVEAERLHREAHALRQRLAEQFPEVAEYQDDLGLAERALGGERHLRSAIERFSRLVDQYPDQMGYQDHLAATRGVLADHLAQTERPAKAAEIYRSLVPIYERLTEDAPNSPGHHNSLAQALGSLAEALKDTGDYEQAGEALRRAVEVRRRLVADFPRVPKYKADLANSYDMLGIFYRERGASQAAYDAFDGAIGLLSELTEAFPEVPGYQRSLALRRNNLGGAYYDARRYEDAIEQFRAAIAIQEQLVHRFPNDTGLRYDLGLGYNNLGAVLDDAGKRAEAGRVLESAVEFVEALVRDAPGERDHRELLVMAYCNLGGQRHEAGQYAEARPCYDAAIAELDGLTAAYPDSVLFRFQLATLLWNLGLLQQDAGNLEEAESPLRRSVELWEELVERMPSRAPLWQGLYNAHEQLSKLYAALDRATDAEPSLRRMLGAADHLPRPMRADPETRHALAKSHERLAEFAQRSDQTEQAAVEYQGALRFFEELSSEHPGDGHYASDVQTTSLKLAALHDRLGRCDDALAVYRDALQFEQQRAERTTGADAPVHRLALAHNALAWYLAGCRDPVLRDPAEAVHHAEQAIALSPEQGGIWNTLGAARYRADDWPGAIEALNKSMELRDGGDAYDWLFLAMAHWQSGDADAARAWYERASGWMAENRSEDERLDELRAEAAELIEEE